MRNIFFPHYLSGEPSFPHYLSGEPLYRRRVHEGRLAQFNVRMNIMSDNK